MNVKTRKPDLQAQFMAAELVEAKGWRNLYLRRSGNAVLGSLVFPTIIEAKKHADDWIEYITKQFATGKYDKGITPSGFVYYKSDFPMTVIQIPSVN